MTTATRRIVPIEVDLESNERVQAEPDNLLCDRGRHCAGLRIGDRPQPIGYYLDADDIARKAFTFEFDDDSDYLMCEDCAVEIEQNPPGTVLDPVAEGQIDTFSWNVDIADGLFQAFVWVNGADHGTTFEEECGLYRTLPSAVFACEEFIRQVMEPPVRPVSRIVHDNEVCVPTGLTGEELDIVLHPAEHGDQEVTVRSMLVDASRRAVAEVVGQLAESGRLDV